MVYNKRFDQHAPLISLGVQREICRRLATGKTLKEICADADIPKEHHIYDLIWRDPAFKRMYKDARLARAEVWAEQLRELASEAKNLDGIAEKKSMAHVQAIRLQVDTDKWLLSKLLNEEYGDELPEKNRGGATAGDAVQLIREVIKLTREEKVAKATVITPELNEKNPDT